MVVAVPGQFSSPACSIGSSEIIINIKERPVPLILNDNTLCMAEPFLFRNGTKEVDNSFRYLWDFGDGTTSTERSLLKYLIDTAKFVTTLRVCRRRL